MPRYLFVHQNFPGQFPHVGRALAARGDTVVDSLDGRAGADTLTGGAGSDTFTYSALANGVDRITDFGSDDQIRVSATLSTLGVTAGDGSTVTASRVQANSAAGVTTLSIDTDNIIGADTLIGLAGNDTLDGGVGTDILYGQAGTDTFVIRRGTQTDIVADFAKGQDRLDISEYGYASLASAKAAMVQVGADIAFYVGAGDLVILQNIGINALTAAEFVF